MSHALDCFNQQLNQQPKVDLYFESVALEWRQLYRNRDLKSEIFSYRQAVALNWIAESVSLKNADVLDVGCGAGPATVALAQRGARVKAIDTVARMVNLTQQGATEAGIGDLVEASVGDVHSLHFPSSSFDAAVVIGVIYWLHSPTKALSEVFRVLKPGGYLVVSADNAQRITYTADPAHLPWILVLRRRVGRLLRQLGLRKDISSIPVNRYSTREFDELITAAGFRKVKQITVGFGPFSFCECRFLPDLIGVKLHGFLQRLGQRGFRALAGRGNHYVVLAQKPL